MINLTRGVPAPESYALAEFAECFKKAMEEDGAKAMSYVASPGYEPLIHLIADQEKINADQVVIGNGSLELLQFLTYTETQPGDCVFVESPSYDRANLLMKRRGLNPIGIPLETDGVDLNVLQDALKKHQPKFFYLIPDFQNPMGVTYSLEKRKTIAELAQKYHFFVVEDSPYRSLRYVGEDLPTLSSFVPPELSVRMTSYSKTLAPGLRMGVMMGNPQIIKRVKTWAGDTYIGPVSPTQALTYQFIKSGYYEPNLKKIKELYAPRLAKALEVLDRELPGAVYPRPEGGFFIGVTLPEGNDMATLIPRAKEAGINITDGRGFYLNPEDGKRFLRIPFCGLKPAEIEEALGQLIPLLVK